MASAPPGASPSSGPGAGMRARRSGQVRRLLVLALLAAVSVAWVTASDRVAIEVDGDVVSLRSYADTVDEVLEAAGVEVGPDDLVEPGPEAAVADGLAIHVTRATPVTLNVDGRFSVLPVAGDTVADVLVAAGIDDVRGLSVVPDPSTPLAGVRRVDVVEPTTVRIQADGQDHVVRIRQGTVGDALELAGVRVRPHDDVSHPPSTVLDADTGTVTVTRRDHEQVVEEVRLPFHEDVHPSDELFDDEAVVVQEGREGMRVDTYRVTRVDGRVTGRELVSQEVATEPVDRVVHVGTAPRPEPTPQPQPDPDPEPDPEPAAPPPPPPPPADADDDRVWDRLAQCESLGNWAAHGAYHGGLQFHPDTWNRWKPDGYPTYAYEASREQQIEVGKRLQAARGWSPWPHCAEELGLK